MNPAPHRPVVRSLRALGAAGLLSALVAVAAAGCGADAPPPAETADPNASAANASMKSAEDMANMRLDGEEPGTKAPKKPRR